MRETLKIGECYQLKSSLEYRSIYIDRLVGYGATCIVYEGYYLDEFDMRHHVRIKECCPVDAVLEHRKANDAIVWLSGEKKDHAEKNFIQAYKRQLAWQNKKGITNSISKIETGLLEANGTKYILMEYDEGVTFDQIRDCTLYDKFRMLHSLMVLLEKYHQEGWLHLDVKPENFVVIPETPELIKLFDFDSLLSIDRLREHKIDTISFSREWAAPEVKQGQMEKISVRSDIYSVGVLLFYLLFGRSLTIADMLSYGKYPLEQVEELKSCNPKIISEIKEFLKRALAPNEKRRYENMLEARKSLEQIIQDANPNHSYICNAIPVQNDYFVGRDKELEEVYHLLTKEKMVAVTGIGGIGKSEFGKQFANKYKQNFAQIIWNRVENSIEDILLDTSKIVIYNDDKIYENVAERIAAIQKRVDQETLFIFDNIVDYSEKVLQLLLKMDCKFLCISRSLPKGFIKPECVISLDCMDTMVLSGLFKTYYKPTGKTENQTIEELIEQIGNYTLLVPIVAKQCTESGISPQNMLKKIRKTGITTPFAEKIWHTKDELLREQYLYQYVCELFVWGEFSEDEKIAIRVLALLWGYTISKKQLAGLCGFWCDDRRINAVCEDWMEVYFENTDVSVINGLIRKGLFQYDDCNGRVALHDVFTEVALKELHPNRDNCGELWSTLWNFYDEIEQENLRTSYQTNFYSALLRKISATYSKYCDCSVYIPTFYLLFVENGDLNIFNELERIEQKCTNEALKVEIIMYRAMVHIKNCFSCSYVDQKKEREKFAVLQNALQALWTLAKENIDYYWMLYQTIEFFCNNAGANLVDLERELEVCIDQLLSWLPTMKAHEIDEQWDEIRMNLIELQEYCQKKNQKVEKPKKSSSDLKNFDMEEYYNSLDKNEHLIEKYGDEFEDLEIGNIEKLFDWLTSVLEDEVLTVREKKKLLLDNQRRYTENYWSVYYARLRGWQMKLDFIEDRFTRELFLFMEKEKVDSWFTFDKRECLVLELMLQYTCAGPVYSKYLLKMVLQYEQISQRIQKMNLSCFGYETDNGMCLDLSVETNIYRGMELCIVMYDQGFQSLALYLIELLCQAKEKIMPYIRDGFWEEQIIGYLHEFISIAKSYGDKEKQAYFEYIFSQATQNEIFEKTQEQPNLKPAEKFGDYLSVLKEASAQSEQEQALSQVKNSGLDQKSKDVLMTFFETVEVCSEAEWEKMFEMLSEKMKVAYDSSVGD